MKDSLHSKMKTEYWTSKDHCSKFHPTHLNFTDSIPVWARTRTEIRRVSIPIPKSSEKNILSSMKISKNKDFES